MSTGIVTGPLADLALHIHELEQRATTAECGLEEALQEVGRLRARVEAVLPVAHDGKGNTWWIHDCGMVGEFATRPGPHACESCGNAPAPWGRLLIEQNDGGDRG